MNVYGDVFYLNLKEVMNRTKKLHIVKRRKKKESTNSQIFKHILYCLASGQHIHMLRKLNNDISQFEIKFTNKKSPKWTRNDISFFKDLDSVSSRVRNDQTSDEMCKVRFKANMAKLCKGGFLELIANKPESKSVKWKSYRILKLPLNDEKKAKTRKKKSASTVSVNLPDNEDGNVVGTIHFRSNFENNSCTEIAHTYKEEMKRNFYSTCESQLKNQSTFEGNIQTSSEEVEGNFYSACESHLKNQSNFEENIQTSVLEENIDFNVDGVFQYSNSNLLTVAPSSVIDVEQSLANSYAKLAINNGLEQSMENYEELMINEDPLLSSTNQIGLGEQKDPRSLFDITDWMTEFRDFS